MSLSRLELRARRRSEESGKSQLAADRADPRSMERHGLIWVKQRGNQDVLPQWTQDGYEFLYSGCWRVNAPVEVMLDNFTEVEHTATAHW